MVPIVTGDMLSSYHWKMRRLQVFMGEALTFRKMDCARAYHKPFHGPEYDSIALQSGLDRLKTVSRILDGKVHLLKMIDLVAALVGTQVRPDEFGLFLETGRMPVFRNEFIHSPAKRMGEFGELSYAVHGPWKHIFALVYCKMRDHSRFTIADLAGVMFPMISTEFTTKEKCCDFIKRVEEGTSHPCVSRLIALFCAYDWPMTSGFSGVCNYAAQVNKEKFGHVLSR